MIRSPFASLSKITEKKVTYILLVLLLGGVGTMRYFDSFITNKVADKGIVSFELAKTLKKSTAILGSWDKNALSYATMSLWVDFLFLLIYSSFIALLIHKLNEVLWKEKPFYKIGLLFIWMQFVAAFCDVIENIALLQQISGKTTQFWVSLAYYFAVLKFALILLGIGYLIIDFLVFLIKRNTIITN